MLLLVPITLVVEQEDGQRINENEKMEMEMKETVTLMRMRVESF